MPMNGTTQPPANSRELRTGPDLGLEKRKKKEQSALPLSNVINSPIARRCAIAINRRRLSRAIESLSHLCSPVASRTFSPSDRGFADRRRRLRSKARGGARLPRSTRTTRVRDPIAVIATIRSRRDTTDGYPVPESLDLYYCAWWIPFAFGGWDDDAATAAAMYGSRRNR